MARVLLLTNSTGASAEVLPAIGLLQHQIRIHPAESTSLVEIEDYEIIFLDARRELPNAKSLSKLIRSTGINAPLILITTEGGLSAVSHDWQADDVILDSAGPAEIEARIRIGIGRKQFLSGEESGELKHGEIVIDEHSYTAKVKGKALDLTFKEFELLKYLAQHPGRVFSRAQLLKEIWGFDYFGGTRTVDVHVRRLRAKLGPEFESQIDTVRNVGYKFNAAPTSETANLN